MIEVAGITKDFASPHPFGKTLPSSSAGRRCIRALDDVSFSLSRGEVLCILGPNGSGKTTLLKVISTLLAPDSGTASINGLALGSDDEMIRASIGFTFSSDRTFYWRLTGRQNLEFFAALYGLTAQTARRRADELYAIFGVDYQDRRFDTYSAGMQQTFSLIRALIHEPGILLLDEPTRSLDYLSAVRLRESVRSHLIGKLGKTVIFTTHRVEEAEELADKVMVITSGRVRAFDTIEGLHRRFGAPDAGLGRLFAKIVSEGSDG